MLIIKLNAVHLVQITHDASWAGISFFSDHMIHWKNKFENFKK